MFEDIEKEVEKEEANRLRAKKKEYKYQEAYGSLFYTDIPKTKAKQIRGIDGEGLTQISLDSSFVLNEVFISL